MNEEIRIIPKRGNEEQKNMLVFTEHKR